MIGWRIISSMIELSAATIRYQVQRVPLPMFADRWNAYLKHWVCKEGHKSFDCATFKDHILHFWSWLLEKASQRPATVREYLLIEVGINDSLEEYWDCCMYVLEIWLWWPSAEVRQCPGGEIDNFLVAKCHCYLHQFANTTCFMIILRFAVQSPAIFPNAQIAC